MRLRNIKNASVIIENSNYVIKNPNDYKSNWNKVFENNNLIYIEIGMGKGKFIIENALKYKDVNFIGIEKYDSVLVKAIKRVEKLDIKNLKFIRCDASTLNNIFDKEISLIYLNFSDPWPKDRHYKRRLTSNDFLNIYDNIFKDKKHIVMKTDNRGLYEFSIMSLLNYGYKLKNISLDLHNSNIKDIITTEYEKKFIEKGNVIYMLECYKD